MKGSNPAPPKGPKPKPPRNPPPPTEGGMIEQPRTFEDWLRRRREREEVRREVQEALELEQVERCQR